MKKSDREIVFNKFGGRCSYCGRDLTNTRWHVDHAEPVERKYERKGGGVFLRGTDTYVTEKDFADGKIPDYEKRESKLVVTGFHKPENDTIDNMMPACASCNINKHSMNIEEFRRQINGFVVSLNRDSVQYKVAKRYGLIAESGISVEFYFETINKGVNIVAEK